MHWNESAGVYTSRLWKIKPNGCGDISLTYNGIQVYETGGFGSIRGAQMCAESLQQKIDLERDNNNDIKTIDVGILDRIDRQINPRRYK